MKSNASQRVLLMKENFMRLHNEGKTILEIAEKYGIRRETVYHNLAEIARANGVPRDSLLEIPHKPHQRDINLGNKAYIFDVSEVPTLCTCVKEKICSLLTTVEDAMKGE